jgi:hypothetical protein
MKAIKQHNPSVTPSHLFILHRQVEEVHVAFFVVAICILATFVAGVLQGFLRGCAQEGRCLAELMAQLPPEV